MNITVIGTGYVGLVAGTCLADMGNNVICVDNNSEKIHLLQNGIVPIYEPGLEELINSNAKENRLTFSTNTDKAIKQSEVCFIAVGTPQDNDGSVNLDAFMEAAKDIAKSMNGYKVIVNKSTVPVGTAEKITKLIKEYTDYPFDVVSNPEFLKQGNAVDDFLYPDRIIIGSDSQKATNIMQEIYAPYFRTSNRMIVMDVKSAEMTKYAANSYLASRISFMNEMANLCEKLGANINNVRIGISSDSRIGSRFLFPGLGYGGSCFPKDINALIKMGEDNSCTMNILNAVNMTNSLQRVRFVDKITSYFGNDLNGLRFAVWGLSFKPKTDDMREAPSVTVINQLMEKGARITAYDPKAIENAKKIFGNEINYARSSYDTLTNADALLLITEWNEFRKPDFNRVKSLLKNPVIFDGRNLYNKTSLTELGIKYFNFGEV